ncbi:Serine protease snake [Anthophora retusa]
MLLPRSSLSTVTTLLSLVLLLSNLISSNAQDEGESCKVDGSTGVCTRLQNCQPVYQELLQGKPPRGKCGFSGFDPIVCCPTEKKRPTTPPTTTTTTTTTVRTTTKDPFSTIPFVDDGRGVKTRTKCQEYARSVYVTEIPPILSADRVPVNRSLCKIKTRKLIVGGKKADPKEFPHMAAIGYPTGDSIVWGCGGTLISERFVLSAAHCTFSSSLGVGATWARLGDLNLERSDDDARPQNIRIIERIRHPRYRSAVSEYHDIALFKLEREVTFNEWIRPCCLPYSLPDTGIDGKATATGWGRVDWADDASNDLLKVTISLVSQPQCNRTFLNGEKNSRLELGIVDEWMICAGELGKDTCQGDSGGPLVILNPDYNCMYNVIGVTSFGKLCGSITPGVYTRVYNYISWIENIVWP